MQGEFDEQVHEHSEQTFRFHRRVTIISQPIDESGLGIDPLMRLIDEAARLRKLFQTQWQSDRRGGTPEGNNLGERGNTGTKEGHQSSLAGVGTPPTRTTDRPR